MVIPFTYHPGSGGLRIALKPFVKWALKFGLALIQPKHCNYLLVSLPFRKRQKVRNRRTHKISEFVIRDEFDYGVLEQIYGNEDYCIDRLARAPELFGKYDQILDRGKTPLIIDCGANIGLSAHYFLDTFPMAKIIGLEPDRTNYDQAIKNCSSANVQFLPCAIASECKRGTLVDPGLGAWGLRVDDDANGRLEMKSVNSLLSDRCYADYEPFIIKIDIEGYEDELFSKNTEWIARFPLLIIELHDWLFPTQQKSRNLLKYLSEANRDFVFLGENVFSVANTLH